MKRIMRCWHHTLLLLTGLLLAMTARGELIVGEGFQRADLSAYSELRYNAERRDPATEMAATDWQPQHKPVVLNFTHESVWQRFTIRRGDNGPTRLMLEVASPIIDELDIYVLVPGQPVRQYLLGDTRPVANRALTDRTYVVPLTLPTATPVTIVLRAHSHGTLSVPVFLWAEPAFVASRQVSVLAYSFVYGAILSALLVFLFVTRDSREPGYHAALLFLFVLTLYQAHADGLLNQYLPIDGDWWNRFKTPLLGSLVALVGILFASRMLQLPAHLPASRVPLRLLYALYGLVLPATLYVMKADALPWLTGGVLGWALAGVLFGLYALYRRLPLAGVYTAMMALFLVGAVGSSFGRVNVAGSASVLHSIMLACIMLQVLVLGYVLLHRIRWTTRERREAESQALAARKRALAAEWHMAYELEREVERQTGALSQTMKELREANRQLAEMSLHDGLTGLHNRRHFDERFPSLVQLAMRRQEPLTVMMLDIDHFKKINDEHGHLVGDDCLKQTAAVMRRVLGRSTDLLARYGGEEFVAVLPATGKDDAVAIAERIRSAVAATPLANGNTSLQVSISIGVAVRVPTTSDGIDLLRDADNALYRAKKSGRNRVEID